ncbi:YaaC family protein [Altererythrobacter lutimaris]|uniref:Uncharacterized protein n=1 Tax=Altererythrobacter lutimaris TaxID=2743979 RepID=A0A850HDQ3_9SPHN|nr:YaaC family protein [Altererythrobacter lutimaris]NVE94888.1 hypothetical protein [Altererythrobacter lutimaris]
MHKSVKNVQFDKESVLSNDPWSYVELWLKREKHNDALPFWIQARRFSDAAKSMPTEAAPLPLYYSFLNCTKALLLVAGQNHGDTHGVAGSRPSSAKSALSNEAVSFQTGGVLAALCAYFGDTAGGAKYTLKDLLWNLPFIHRAFCLTFPSSPELFIPIEEACYVSRDDTSEAWFQARIVNRYADMRRLRNLPDSFEIFSDTGGTFVRRKKRFKWYRGRKNNQEKAAAAKRLTTYHSTTRRVVVPISGKRDLWYLKKSQSSNPLASRHTLAIVFASMHRLSELSRYDPKGFSRHLDGSANWLITEFIEHAPSQFLDQISSEITGLEFWRPGTRA